VAASGVARLKSTHSRNYAVLTRLLREGREAAGVSQVELAKRLHRPQSFISKVDVIEFLEVMRALGQDPIAALRRLTRQ
jgi:ribosome-binding protein aMBF1 (putative translation factor)